MSRNACEGPYVVVLAGGIASGKSTVARMLEEHGALRIDLDELSRQATSVGSPAVQRIACEFGADVVDEHGALRRAELARRAFATPESTRVLEDIVHPAIFSLLASSLAEAEASRVCVVEVPLLDRAEELVEMADEVVCVVCPLDERCRRARLRGLDEDDFYARVSRQTSDAYLEGHATTVIRNDKSERHLRACVEQWWREREKRGWGHGNGRT